MSKENIFKKFGLSSKAPWGYGKEMLPGYRKNGRQGSVTRDRLGTGTSTGEVFHVHLPSYGACAPQLFTSGSTI